MINLDIINQLIKNNKESFVSTTEFYCNTDHNLYIRFGYVGGLNICLVARPYKDRYKLDEPPINMILERFEIHDIHGRPLYIWLRSLEMFECKPRDILIKPIVLSYKHGFVSKIFFW